jgi:WXG100 family type VII secretion target
VSEAGRIAVTVSEVTAAGARLEVAGLEQQQRYIFVTRQLSSLWGAFEGEAATSFHKHMDQWFQSAMGLAKAIDSLGAFLTGAAQDFEQLDVTIASGMHMGSSGAAGSAASEDVIKVDAAELTALANRLAAIATDLESAAVEFDDDGSIQSTAIDDALKQFCGSWHIARGQLITSLNEGGGVLTNAADQFNQHDAKLRQSVSGGPSGTGEGQVS